MQLLYLSSQIVSTYGGAEKTTENMIQKWPDVEHVFLGGTRSWYDLFQKYSHKAYLSSAGIEPVTGKNLALAPISFIKGFIQFLRFRSLIQSCDAIYCSLPSFSEVFFLLPWVRIFLKKPIIFMAHTNCPKAIYRNPLRFILQWLFQRHPVIFNTNASLQSYTSRGISVPLAKVIFNGVTQYGEPVVVPKSSPTLTLGFLGRMQQKNGKGLNILFSALSKMQPEIQWRNQDPTSSSHKIRLLIGGQGEDLEYFQNLAKELNLESFIDIQWLGFVQDTKSFYEQLDVLIFPSIHKEESFGLVLAESWERGVPVLCSDLPALIELKALAHSEEQKLVFPMGNVGELQVAIAHIMDSIDVYRNAKYRNQLSDLSKKYFDINQTLANYRKVITEHAHTH